MDLGIYRRNRTRLWSLLVIPLAIFSGVYIFSYHQRQRLDQKLAAFGHMTRLIPKLEAGVTAARTGVIQLDQFGNEPLSEDVLSGRIASSAHATGVVMAGLKTETPEGIAPGLLSRRILVRAEGALPALMRFVDQVQIPGRLVQIDAVILDLLRNDGEPVYAMELRLRLGSRK